MAEMEISGAVKAEDVPVEARGLMQKGIWLDAAQQISGDRKRGLVTVLTVRTTTPEELESEFRRMRNGLSLPLRKYGLRLQMSIVRDKPTEARCYMRTVELEPQKRNGRAK